MTYQRLSFPTIARGIDARASVRHWTQMWLESPALRDLVKLFGGPDPIGASVDDLLTFASTHWDFRRGRERNLAQRVEFDHATEAQIMASAEGLGLKTPVGPQRDVYDYLLVLGGLVQACVSRTQAAAVLTDSGVHVGEVAGLSAFRPLGGDEPVVATAGGFGHIKDEFGAMDAGVKRAFRIVEGPEQEGHVDSELPGASWLVTSYRDYRGVRVRVIAAPSSQPRTRRANTEDTYRFWAEQVAHLARTTYVLVVTSTIYVPYQGLSAIRVLAQGYGCGVETIGIDPSNVPEATFRQYFTAANYLQEVLSTLRAIAVAQDTGQ